jgi:hypothetical protein
MEEQDLGFGNKIIGFSTYEEMQAYIDQQADELAESMKHLAPEQLNIALGTHVLRLVGEENETSLAIFGYIFTVEELVTNELNAGATSDELLYMLDKSQDLFEQGYRYGNWISRICPEGEVGDAHISTLWPISEADYEHARNNRWLMPKYLLDRVGEEMNNRKETDD